MLPALAAMPVNVVLVRPMIGMRTKPAASEPIAAPAVLAPYRRPAAPPGRVGEVTATRTAMGKVAPSATPGTRSTPNELAILTVEKRSPAPSSPVRPREQGCEKRQAARDRERRDRDHEFQQRVGPKGLSCG